MVRKTLIQGDRCPMAATVQALLRAKGYMPHGNAEIDVEWGKNCDGAATAFQEETIALGLLGLEELKADGEIGVMSLQAFRMRWGTDLTTLPDSFWPQVEE